MQERGFTSEKEAKKALRKRLNDVDDGNHVAPTQETFQQYADEWLVRRSADWRASTLHSYKRNLTLHVDPTLGQEPLQKITARKLEALYGRLQQCGRSDHAKGQGLSGRSVRYVHTIIKAILADATEKDVLQQNPALSAHPVQSKDRGLMATWTREQLGAFLSATADTRLGPLWPLLVMTGMQRDEALGLGWSSVDLDGKRLRVERSLVDADWGQPVFNDPKTEKGSRTVLLDDETVKVLRKLRSAHLDERLFHGPGYRDFDLVFAHPDGGPLHPDRISGRFRELTDRAGLPPVRLHDLRHTNATLLMESGIPAHVVQQRLGHSHVSITLGTYARVTATMDDEAAGRMAALVG